MLHFPSLFALQLHFLVGFVHFPLIGKPRNWWLCTMPPLRREGFALTKDAWMPAVSARLIKWLYF
jgi:hypothetical protein